MKTNSCLACWVLVFGLTGRLAMAMGQTQPQTCRVAGDPHVLTYTGDKMSLPVPCQYTVTRVDSKSPSLESGFQTTSVFASNGVRPVHGTFFVSNVEVRVEWLDLQSREWFTGKFATGADNIRQAYQDDNDNLAWTITGQEEVLALATTQFFRDTKEAVLTLGDVIRVSFRPAKPNGGLVRRSLPGVTVELLSNGKVTETTTGYPFSICNNHDPSYNLTNLAVSKQMSKAELGVLAVLFQRDPQSIASDDANEMCQNVSDEFSACTNKEDVVRKCGRLLTSARLARCVERTTGQPVLRTFLDCVHHHCATATTSTTTNWACEDPDDLSARCHEMRDMCRLANESSKPLPP